MQKASLEDLGDIEVAKLKYAALRQKEVGTLDVSMHDF